MDQNTVSLPLDEPAFSYAEPDDPFFLRLAIGAVERATGQPKLKRLYLENRRNPRAGESFFAACVRQMGVTLDYDPAPLATIPRQGPVVFVSNHPFGVVDGLSIGSIVEKARQDFLILTNAVLLRAPEIRPYVLPVDFAGTAQARETNVASRQKAREHLAAGGSLIVFPSGVVSTTPDFWGRQPAVDPRWQPFVAQLVQKAQAHVAPIYFAGQNSRLFQVVSHINQTLRLALLFHEVTNKLGSRIEVAIGEAAPFDAFADIRDRQALADELQARTYALAQKIRAGRQSASAAPAI